MSASAFYDNYSIVTINDVYKTLIPLVGSLAATIFALTLLISGISSSTLGTIVGQAIFEDLLGKRLTPWLRRSVTRVLNIIPTSIVIFLGIEPLDILV